MKSTSDPPNESPVKGSHLLKRIGKRGSAADPRA